MESDTGSFQFTYVNIKIINIKCMINTVIKLYYYALHVKNWPHFKHIRWHCKNVQITDEVWGWSQIQPM
jgi:hypothetical protein